jgi:FdhE protein
LPITTDAIISSLKEQEKRDGTLPELLKFYQKLLRVQLEVEQKTASLPLPDMGSQTARERIERGQPLIQFEELGLDSSMLADTFIEVVTVFAEYPELFGELPEKMKESSSGELLSRKAVNAWFEGAGLPREALAGESNENLLMAIIHATLKPFLTRYARAAAGVIDQERWRQRYCPVCGGSPDFASLDRESGARHLVCSRCDTEWLFQRLECPYCGTQDQSALSYFTDDRRLYRLYICEECKQYLKTIDLRQATEDVILPLERLFTLDIDRQAREGGYLPIAGTSG